MAAVLAVQFRNLGFLAATWCAGLVGAGLQQEAGARLDGNKYGTIQELRSTFSQIKSNIVL